jgi:hypothetical protein
VLGSWGCVERLARLRLALPRLLRVQEEEKFHCERTSDPFT